MASSGQERDAGLAAFLPLFGLTLLGAGHELVVRQTDAYLCPGLGAPRSLRLGLGLGSLALGLWLGRRALPRAACRTRLLLRLVTALSLTCSASGALWFWAFQTPAALGLVALALPTLAGVLSGAALGALLSGLGLAYRELGSIRWLLAPLPLFGALAFALLAAVSRSYAGLWRAAAGFGVVCSLLCLLLGRFSSYFSDRAPPAPAPAGVALAGAAVSLAVAQAFVPASVLARYPSEVVWTAGADHELVITSAQNTFQLFEAGQLRLSSADAYRLAELAVHPVLSRAKPGRRVLLLGPAGDVLEYAVLRHASVRELVSLSETDVGRFAATRWPESAHGRLSDPRLRRVIAEPLPWLEQGPGGFDTIIVALPAPASHAEGKYYTAYFYQLLERHLSPTGALVVQATSRAALPQTFATIRETLRANGAALTGSEYEAQIPLQGAVSFIVAARTPFVPSAARLPRGLSFVDGPALARSFTLSAAPSSSAPISTLDHQRAVETFHHEQAALGN